MAAYELGLCHLLISLLMETTGCLTQEHYVFRFSQMHQNSVDDISSFSYTMIQNYSQSDQGTFQVEEVYYAQLTKSVI